jgi:integrase
MAFKHPRSSKAATAEILGFESLSLRQKSRSQSGFSLKNLKLGQNPGQTVSVDAIPYKLAKVYNGDKEWFVHYSYWSLSKRKYEREKVRIDQRGLNKEDRQILLDDVARELNEELRARNRRKEYHRELTKESKKRLNASLVEVLAMAAARPVGKKDGQIAPSRKSSYLALATKLEQFYVEHPAFNNTHPLDLDDRFIIAYRGYLQAEDFTGKTINKHLWTIGAIMEECGIKMDIEAYRVKQIKNETNKYPPLTHEEKEIAFAYWKEVNPGYYLMLLCQYYTCIRPAELHRLQVKNFNFKDHTIYVPWADSKNGLSAHVQMFEPLKEALLAAKVHKLPADTFLFGWQCQPSNEEYKGDWASKTWSKHRARMGMPIEKQPYGLKHTFNKDYVENNKKKGGIDWEFLRRHNRHATVQQTQQYISELTAYHLDTKKAKILDYSGQKDTKRKAGRSAA